MTGQPEMRALTVKQPWAWAIAQGGKTIENRRWATRYRGLLTIHASQQWSQDGEADDRVRAAWRTFAAEMPLTNPSGMSGVVGRLHKDNLWIKRGAVVAIAKLADCHTCDGCCSPWADDEWHWQLTDIKYLPHPIPAQGRQGLWKPDDELREAILTEAIR